MSKALIYRIIQTVAGLEKGLRLPGDGVPTLEIAQSLGVTPRYIDSLLAELVNPHYDRCRPWLSRCLRGGVRLTEQGWLTLAGIEKAPYSTPEAALAHEWTQRVRWPWREEDSRIRAVVPTGGTI